jgi:hypothetical protein
VDYIVNAVGLKLAIGDVSPQAPQVLLMMMRLCGPSLLPYLDDLVASIFDALERYHGYPRLTDLLFSVLQGMAEEGVKAPQLAITASQEHHQQKKPPKMSDVVCTIKEMSAEARDREKKDKKYTDVSFPTEPWKETTPDESTTQVDPTDEPTTDIEPPPPAPLTFTILLKISTLTQHYLTTTSPTLRTSLLSLLRTTIPALALHENSFLPLINTLWPVLLPRLQDPEAYVVSNALDIIALMCEHAGGFMRTRVESAWGILRGVVRRTKVRRASPTSIETDISRLSIRTAAQVDSFRPELYVDAPTRMIWNSIVRLFCVIAQHVLIRDDLFDEVLDVLDPVLHQSEVRSALEVGNADAVWLSMHGRRTWTGKRPVGKPGWEFVRW